MAPTNKSLPGLLAVALMVSLPACGSKRPAKRRPEKQSKQNKQSKPESKPACVPKAPKASRLIAFAPEAGPQQVSFCLKTRFGESGVCLRTDLRTGKTKRGHKTALRRRAVLRDRPSPKFKPRPAGQGEKNDAQLVSPDGSRIAIRIGETRGAYISYYLRVEVYDAATRKRLFVLKPPPRGPKQSWEPRLCDVRWTDGGLLVSEADCKGQSRKTRLAHRDTGRRLTWIGGDAKPFDISMRGTSRFLRLSKRVYAFVDRRGAGLALHDVHTGKLLARTSFDKHYPPDMKLAKIHEAAAHRIAHAPSVGLVVVFGSPIPGTVHIVDPKTLALRRRIVIPSCAGGSEAYLPPMPPPDAR